MEFNLNKSNSLRGDITIPPDKSMSHRAVMFNSLAKGKAKDIKFFNGRRLSVNNISIKEIGFKNKH